ncbi:hypothetical protein [Salinisphaera sp. T5B8]|uniref:hypothetical protein n=1 Tax=Salinisphaera sp. T5B8 TaxID=1304154 RepID=UPI003340A3E1
MRLQKRIELGLNGLFDDALCTIANQIGQRVRKGWISKGNRRIVLHGGGTSSVV